MDRSLVGHALLGVALALLTFLTPVFSSLLAAETSPAVDGEFTAAIVMDAMTGETLMAKQPHLRLPPASMVKMMTELLVLERVDSGEISMSDSVTISAKASQMGGSQVYLKDGERFTVDELLHALAIHSANDAAGALAEHVAGTTEAFVMLMNQKAQDLKMHDTEFHSCHGLPPARNQKSDLTSAYDMALLCLALLAHPESTQLASQKEAPFRGGDFILHNPNPLIGKFPGMDGMKTGYTAQAGYCLTATAKQKGGRLISVVMNAPSIKARSAETARLLTRGFAQFTTVKLVESANVPLDVPVRVEDGTTRDVVVAYGSPLSVLVLKNRADKIVLETEVKQPLRAPLRAGDIVGRAIAKFNGMVLGEVPIVALENVARGNLFQRLLH